ncbi:MAG: hypothetical protein ACRDI1_08675, partial [Actinomycetota bacterium]
MGTATAYPPNGPRAKRVPQTTSNDPRYRLDYLGYLLDLLPPAARVVELGCGPGLPVARAISEKHRFVGVDISAE